MEITLTKKQNAFINSKADETLYGGAAGGGKSHGQLIDALLFGLKYPKSKQIIFRRTYSDLEKSIIRMALEIYPTEYSKYNATNHCMRLNNGSLIDFGYCDNDTDVLHYQSAEYDVIRFDELTHFTEYMYTYLISRCRGTNSYPKQIKSSTNPGGVGHTWVKNRFIDIGAPNKTHNIKIGTNRDGNVILQSRLFIPAFVNDNKFLMENDSDYINRLENLNETQKRALLYGDWDIFEGQYFGEFDRSIHVCKPFVIPDYWNRYVAFDYGLDMFACYFFAVDNHNKTYVYKEIYKSGLIVSEAVRELRNMINEHIQAYFAPPDMWNKHKDTGKSTAEIFFEYGIPLYKTSNDRVQGWYNIHEYLKPYKDEQGVMTAKLQIFNNCQNLIRCLPMLQFNPNNPNDVSKEPHEITHAPDALRYFLSGRPLASTVPVVKTGYEELDYDEQIDDFINYGMSR